MKQIAIALLAALAVVIGLNMIALIVGIAEMYSHQIHPPISNDIPTGQLVDVPPAQPGPRLSLT